MQYLLHEDISAVWEAVDKMPSVNDPRPSASNNRVRKHCHYKNKLKKITLSHIQHGSIVYTREQLLALRRPGLPFNDKISAKLRRRWRGCRTSVKRRERACQYKTCLPAIVMGNICSLSNRIDELMVLTQLQWEYRDAALCALRSCGFMRTFRTV